MIRLVPLAMSLLGAACVTAPGGGALGDVALSERPSQPRITGIDTAFPPRAVSVEMTHAGYAAVFLVAPGHSATLLYPADSATDNQLVAGPHRLAFEVPSVLAQSDSERIARARAAARTPGRARVASRERMATPIPPSIATYLLFLTSPQPLVYERMIERTGGVSIPTIETEALNAVAKAIKGTLTEEPREWAGYYQPVELRARR